MDDISLLECPNVVVRAWRTWDNLAAAAYLTFSLTKLLTNDPGPDISLWKLKTPPNWKSKGTIANLEVCTYQCHSLPNIQDKFLSICKHEVQGLKGRDYAYACIRRSQNILCWHIVTALGWVTSKLQMNSAPRGYVNLWEQLVTVLVIKGSRNLWQHHTLLLVSCSSLLTASQAANKHSNYSAKT